MKDDFPLPPGFKVIPRAPGIGHEEPLPGDTSLDVDDLLLIMKKYLRPALLNDPRVPKFIRSYLDCRNASQAARESGGSPGWRRNPEVHACIEAITSAALMKYGYDASEVIERVKEIAAIDPVEFENPDGSYKTHLSQISPEARRAIKKFKVKNLYGEDANGMQTVIGQLVEVELWDKMKSLELLGREKNIMKETKKIEHDLTANMASVLLASKERAEQRMVIEVGRGDVKQIGSPTSGAEVEAAAVPARVED